MHPSGEVGRFQMDNLSSPLGDFGRSAAKPHALRMPEQHTPFPWSIELASGWVVETRLDPDRTEFMAIIPKNKDALLRLTTYNPDERDIDAVKWVESVAHINRVKGRSVTSIRCGDFSGYTLRFATSDESLRGWVMRAGSFPLDVSYRCDLKNSGRDDLLVDHMLKTLLMNKQYVAEIG